MKRKAITEITTVELSGGQPAFVPFTENEIVKNISFSSPTDYTVETVEGLKEKAGSITGNNTILDVRLKTKCLIISAKETVNAEIETIK